MEATVAQVFHAAIAAEHAARTLFEGLSAKFAAYPDIAEFWASYAREEAHHAQWLAQLRDKVTPEVLARTVDAQTTEMLRLVAEISVEKALASVHNLDEAYNLVNEVEGSETNAIFSFLVDNFEADESMRVFLRAQLHQHVAKLKIDLPTRYRSAAVRQSIQASL